MRKKKKTKKNTSLAIFFIAFIIGAILLSFFIKVFFLIKTSKFDNGNIFSVYVTNKNENKLISFQKNSNSISVLEIDGRVEDIHRQVQVSIEAIYYDPDIRLDKSVSEIISDMLFGISSSKNNLNIIDALRIFSISKTINSSDIKTEIISINSSDAENDKIIQALLADLNIEEEGLSIEIINMSQEQGVGSRYARLISNMGGNVILVSNGQDKIKSGIYTQKDSYTAGRIGKILGFPLIKEKVSRIADMAIVIGDNYPKLSKY